MIKLASSGFWSLTFGGKRAIAIEDWAFEQNSTFISRLLLTLRSFNIFTKSFLCSLTEPINGMFPIYNIRTCYLFLIQDIFLCFGCLYISFGYSLKVLKFESFFFIFIFKEDIFRLIFYTLDIFLPTFNSMSFLTSCSYFHPKIIVH